MAFMYDDNGTKIGTKSRQAGHGLEKPNGGGYGDGVTMNFNPPKPKNSIVNSLAQSKKSQFPNNYPNGIQRPNLSLKLDNNNKDIGNFLQYLTDKRNADMMQKYDALNMKNNQFIQTLKNSKYQANQGRLEKQYLQDKRLTQQQGQYNSTYDFNTQKFDKTHDFEMQKYLHPVGKTDNSEKYKIDRTKLFTKDPASLVPHWDKLDDNQKNQVRNSYIQNGTIPKLKAYDGESWFGDDYKIDGEQAQAPNSKPTKQAPNTNFINQKTAGNKTYVQDKNGKWFMQ